RNLRRGYFGDNSSTADPKFLKAIEDPLEHRFAENIQQSDRNSTEYFFALCTRAAHQNERPYIHGDHLGAAARKIADRDGTQPGIRRNREIGSSAFARLCKSNERRYWRMIWGIVILRADEKFCSDISRCNSEFCSNSIRREERLCGSPVP